MESFMGRIGGKRLLRNEILKRFPTTRFERYIEPFGGAGWLLFAKESHAPNEIFNDIDGELINLFRCIKYHCAELQQHMQLQLHSRELFNDALALKSMRGLTDIQRAAQYFTVVKQSYGCNGRDFGATPKNLEGASAYFTKVCERLRKVKIEHQSYDQIISHYDSENSFFYLDPPYWGTEKYYDFPFDENHHKNLCSILKNIKGLFVLSYGDSQTIREMYCDFKMETLVRNDTLKSRYKDKEHTYTELLIKNF